MHKRLLDWPQLARYREENEKLEPLKPGERRAVFYGDSITDAWPSRGRLFSSRKSFVGRGISGQTTPQMLVRFRQDVLDLHPAVVVILAGINDIAGNTGPQTDEAIQDNFRSMVALARAEHVRVVLCSILPAKSFPWNPGVDPRPRVKQLNAWLKDFAAKQHLVYVDYFSAMVDTEGGLRPELGEDPVHPNAAGYAVMEPLAEAGIAKALKQRP